MVFYNFAMKPLILVKIILKKFTFTRKVQDISCFLWENLRVTSLV